MSGNLSRGWRADYLPKNLLLKKKKKKFAGNSMLSEVLRHDRFLLPVGLVCVRHYTHNLYMFPTFFSLKACQLETFVSRGFVALNCQRTKLIKMSYWHGTDSCYGDMFVYSEAKIHTNSRQVSSM